LFNFIKLDQTLLNFFFKLSAMLKLISSLFAIACFCGMQAQIVVGLDNWYNAEISSETGYPYHYLWSDMDDSGYSRWGDIFKSKGAGIVRIYKPDIESLRQINVYIIVDPDSVIENPKPNFFTQQDIMNITDWVRNGGVLVLMANDSKHCALSGLNKLASRFGMTFNNVMLHPVINNQYEMGAYASLPDHPVFKDVQKIFMKEVASIRLSADCTAVLTENSQAVIAECRFGNGFVFAVGDPWIYNEYIDHDRLPESFENRKAAENLTDYLLSLARDRESIR
jgi:unsaturated rhamnogalacturonyl hydrolase